VDPDPDRWGIRVCGVLRFPFAAREREQEDGGSAWRRIVTAEAEDEAFNRLLDAVPGGDKIVLPAGRRPNPEEEPGDTWLHEIERQKREPEDRNG
jgi:hypothetical protein